MSGMGAWRPNRFRIGWREPWRRSPAGVVTRQCPLTRLARLQDLRPSSGRCFRSSDVRVGSEPPGGSPYACRSRRPWSCAASGCEQGWVQPDRRDPLIHQASILPGADVIASVNPTREQELLRPATSACQPGAETLASGLADLERYGCARLLLDDHRALADLSTQGDVADPQLDDVTSAQLAVDR